MTPAQRCSLTFNDEGKVIKFTIETFDIIIQKPAAPASKAASVMKRVFALMGGKATGMLYKFIYDAMDERVYHVGVHKNISVVSFI